MRFPIGFTVAQTRHRARMEKVRQKRYPTVLMLEPLYTCNLACIGCSVERHTGKLKERMTLETCFKAVDDCGAPIINICGGEPTLYPELKELIEGLIARNKYIILCTNALLLDTKLYGVIPPSDHLFLMIHLDGMRETHDFVCNRQGVFDKAINMIEKGKELGHYVLVLSLTILTELRNYNILPETSKKALACKAAGNPAARFFLRRTEVTPKWLEDFTCRSRTGNSTLPHTTLAKDGEFAPPLRVSPPCLAYKTVLDRFPLTRLLG